VDAGAITGRGSRAKLQMSYFWDTLPALVSSFRRPWPSGTIANSSSGGDKMKKLLAAIFAGMFALTTASAVIAADKKEDTKKDSKKKDSKKKDDKKK
jgi:hypothetical protein